MPELWSALDARKVYLGNEKESNSFKTTVLVLLFDQRPTINDQPNQIAEAGIEPARPIMGTGF
jgi:hypothetical protein